MLKKSLSAVVVSLAVVASSAQAALPTAVDTAITGFQSDATSLIDKGWPLMIAVFGGLLIMKLFKKVANKAT